MDHLSARQLITDLLTDHRSRALEEILTDSISVLNDLPPAADHVDLDAVVSRVFDQTSSGGLVLHQWANLSQIVAVAEQHRRERCPVPTPTDLPCPSWCDRTSCHPFDRYANGIRRDHVHRFGDRGTVVALELIERSPDPTTHITDLNLDPGAFTILIQYGPGQVHYTTAEGARRIAQQLNNAAAAHDAHTETTSRPT